MRVFCLYYHPICKMNNMESVSAEPFKKIMLYSRDQVIEYMLEHERDALDHIVIWLFNLFDECECHTFYSHDPGFMCFLRTWISED